MKESIDFMPPSIAYTIRIPTVGATGRSPAPTIAITIRISKRDLCAPPVPRSYGGEHAFASGDTIRIHPSNFAGSTAIRA